MTIPFLPIKTLFNGLVQIDAIKSYSDPRGFVSEVFRNDDQQFPNSKQCYISETEPLVQRGVHQHTNQTDDFISLNNRLLYRFTHPVTNEVASYITNPKEIIRVIVKPPILHSYVNISDKVAFTMNFPDQLFKGTNKAEEIDEIRYEKALETKPLVIILGAKGRLGKSLTKAFLKQSSIEVTVVPIDWKLNDKFDLEKLFNHLHNAFKGFTGPKYIFNTIANTNTQEREVTPYIWPNVDLPSRIENLGKEMGFKQIFISTDYVFQKDSTSAYTLSKKMADFNLNYSHIVRVANLWHEDDKTNGLIRLHDAAKENNLGINPNIVIFPTNTDDLAETLVKNYQNLERVNHIIPEVYYTLGAYIEKFYKVGYQEKVGLEPWHKQFIENPDVKIVIIPQNDKLQKYVDFLKG